MRTTTFSRCPCMSCKLYAEGDEKTKRAVFLAMEWLKQTNSGTFRTWEDLKELRDNWEGPLIIKGILSVEVTKLAPNPQHSVTDRCSLFQDAEEALKHGVDGIVVSNHGKYPTNR